MQRLTFFEELEVLLVSFSVNFFGKQTQLKPESPKIIKVEKVGIWTTFGFVYVTPIVWPNKN